MVYKCVHYPSLLHTITTTDHLFSGTYTLDPYQNCEFRCRYCDSAEDTTVYIKANAVDQLQQELPTKKKGMIIVGSVHDPYQPIEASYCLTQSLLKVIKEEEFPCHILTKSSLILRDIDVLSTMNECLATISIPTLNESITNIFEKRVPTPSERLQVVQKLSNSGVIAGVAVIPILPFIVEKELGGLVKEAKDHDAHYILHKHLELRGDQKAKYLEVIKTYFPRLMSHYEQLYNNQYMPHKKYLQDLENMMASYCKHYNIPNKIESGHREKTAFK